MPAAELRRNTDVVGLAADDGETVEVVKLVDVVGVDPPVDPANKLDEKVVDIVGHIGRDW